VAVSSLILARDVRASTCGTNPAATCGGNTIASSGADYSTISGGFHNKQQTL
jgi:hypothetical protein